MAGERESAETVEPERPKKVQDDQPVVELNANEFTEGLLDILQYPTILCLFSFRPAILFFD